MLLIVWAGSASVAVAAPERPDHSPPGAVDPGRHGASLGCPRRGQDQAGPGRQAGRLPAGQHPYGLDLRVRVRDAGRGSLLQQDGVYLVICRLLGAGLAQGQVIGPWPAATAATGSAVTSKIITTRRMAVSIRSVLRRSGLRSNPSQRAPGAFPADARLRHDPCRVEGDGHNDRGHHVQQVDRYDGRVEAGHAPPRARPGHRGAQPRAAARPGRRRRLALRWTAAWYCPCAHPRRSCRPGSAQPGRGGQGRGAPQRRGPRGAIATG